MNSTNPAFVLRNHVAQTAIERYELKQEWERGQGNDREQDV